MNHVVGSVILRRPELVDLDALYTQKNDPDVASLLGGFSKGYSRQDIVEWIDRHRRAGDEALWVIADADSDRCLGHVGLYQIDHRARRAEFAIMIGAKDAWGRGIGRQVSAYVVRYGFEFLNLNRIELTVLATNARAIALYEKLGFQREGVLREAQYKAARYVDVVLMAILRDEYGDVG